MGALRIVAHVPSFIPTRRAGSEVSMAATLEMLMERGHRVRVLLDAPGDRGRRGELEVITQPTLRESLAEYCRSDVVFTQLASRNRAMRLARIADRPVVHFLRMGGLDPRTALGVPDLVVFNAEWLQAATPWPGRTTVLHPPVLLNRYETRTSIGDSVTLVNLDARKGASIFFNLARERPDLSFLGVVGGWGTQDLPEPLPPNVTILEPVDDMRLIFSRTRVLLMPSTQETFGRVGLEAACAGIPTIATPLPGIREALGDAALYAERTDFARWLEHLTRLDDSDCYREHSARAKERAFRAAAHHEIADLERNVTDVVTNSRQRQGTRRPLLGRH